MTRSPWLFAVSISLALPAAQAAVPSTKEIADLSLEELAGIEVTSVSRRAEPLSAAPASIYVITADAIHRSGVSSLPEALRLAPNLQVARINATQYAISARGFNNTFGNKLLVLIDGRTVYTPFFSGVLWDQQDVMLADVERIEVISGPGATLWGANAVNGVINVITRSSAETQGLMAVAGGGERERGLALRYGAALGDSGHVRFYAKTANIRHTDTVTDTAVTDGTERHQLGFRADWNNSADTYTLQGDTYRTRAQHRGMFGPFELTPIATSGTNVLGRWTRRLGNDSDLRVQLYFDHSERDDALLYHPRTDIGDAEFQHSMALDSHRLVWGAGYRRAQDHIAPGVFFAFVPASRTLTWTNVFVQDGVKLQPGLELTLGLKFERNDFTGTETLPNLRLAWQPAAGELVWGAVSRAVRAPAQLDRDLRLPPVGPPYIIAGGPDFVSEVANVLELGYRAQPTPAWSYSATAFLHDWQRLRSGQPPPNAQVQNMIEGKTYGVEAWAAWQALPTWRLSAGLSTLQKDLHLLPGSTDPDGPVKLGDDPDYQWSLRSAFTPAEGHEIDVALRRIAGLPEGQVPAYTAVDARYGWRVTRDVELSLVGQNLFGSEHSEFGKLPRSEFPASIALWLRLTL